MNWTATVPVWGDWHIRLYLERVIWRHILMGLDDVRYIVHTDEPNRIRESSGMRRLSRICDVQYRPIPKNVTGHERMSACHEDAMSDADAILFLMPDCVLSVEAFEFVKAAKKKLVALASVRTLSDWSEEVPLHAPDITRWSVAHFHPNFRGAIWNTSAQVPATNPSNIYFKGPNGFWVHAFHLFPLAAVLDRDKRRLSGTVDGSWVNAFPREETYVVRDKEVAQVELTAAEKHIAQPDCNMTDPSSIAKVMYRNACPMHEWFFSQHIMLEGSHNDQTAEIPTMILERLRDLKAHDARR